MGSYIVAVMTPVPLLTAIEASPFESVAVNPKLPFVPFMFSNVPAVAAENASSIAIVTVAPMLLRAAI